jgi:hypothetical protein
LAQLLPVEEMEGKKSEGKMKISNRAGNIFLQTKEKNATQTHNHSTNTTTITSKITTMHTGTSLSKHKVVWSEDLSEGASTN